MVNMRKSYDATFRAKVALAGKTHFELYYGVSMARDAGFDQRV